MDAELMRDLEAPAIDEKRATGWSPLRRIVFRFLCTYLVLYTLPTLGRVSILTVVPFAGSRIGSLFDFIWSSVDAWLGVHLFHLPAQMVTRVRTGSGDTALDYIQEFLFLIIAALVTIGWSVLDRKRTDYRRADAWLRIWIRYTLALTLLSYGIAKVFPLQFGSLGAYRLFETYGESSPMGLLWTFMAASAPYTMFAGFMEFIPALLLFFRRTTALGAFMTAAVMLNVAMLNFCYDVPVKLYSTNLLFMALYLAAPYFGSIARLLLSGREALPPALYEVRFQKRGLELAARSIKFIFLAAILGLNLFQGWKGYRSFYSTQTKPPLYGVWEVTGFTRDGVDVQPLASDSMRWKRLMVEYPISAAIQTMDDRRIWIRTQYDGTHKRVTFGDNASRILSYSQPDSDHLVLEGSWLDRQVRIRLVKVDTSKLLLVNRGFHWINQYPYNR